MPPALVATTPPIWQEPSLPRLRGRRRPASVAWRWASASTQPASTVMVAPTVTWTDGRSEEHTSELQSLMRISYAVFCLKKKKKPTKTTQKQKRTHHRTAQLDKSHHHASSHNPNNND